MRPEDLTLSGLPRSPFGGVKADAVAELLKRVASDYRDVLGRNKQLAQQVEGLKLVRQALEAQVASLEVTAAERKDQEELTRTLLASAQRAAREQRESVRREGELLLKKARERARDIEGEVRAYADAGLAELAKLEAFRDEVVRELQAALETIVELGAESAAAGSEHDAHEEWPRRLHS